MQELGKLFENYWIDRVEDRELFNQVRREVDGYRRFCQEQLGWRLLQNEYVIKLEKVPARALGYMGIRDFTDTRDYVLLCALLIFLDDKEDHEQFLLSELITVLEAQLRNLLPIDWTSLIVNAVPFGKPVIALLSPDFIETQPSPLVMVMSPYWPSETFATVTLK